MNRKLTLLNYKEPEIQEDMRQDVLKIARERKISVRQVCRETGVNRVSMDRFIKGIGLIGFKPLCTIEDWIIEHIIED